MQNKNIENEKNNLIDKIKKIEDKNILNEMNIIIEKINNKQKKKEDFILKKDSEKINLNEDKFKRFKLAQEWANIIINNTKTPYTYAVIGEWGSGKTVFMNFLKENIIKNYNNELIVWIDALKYEKVYDLSYMLVYEFENQIKNEINFKYNIKIKISNSSKKIFDYLENFSFNFGIFSFNLKKRKKNILDEFAKINKIKKEFEKLINVIIKKTNKKIIFFIDNLDRVSPDKVLNFLDSIKYYFSVENCIFIIALDIKIIKYAIQNKYGNLYEYIDEFTYTKKWVDHYIQLEIVPEYIVNFIQENIQKVNNQTIKVILETTSCFNLRTIRRIITKYNLIYNKLLLLNNKEINYDIVFFIVFLNFYSPELIQLFLKYININLIKLIIDSKSVNSWFQTISKEDLIETQKINWEIYKNELYFLINNNPNIPDLFINFIKSFPEKKYIKGINNKDLINLSNNSKDFNKDFIDTLNKIKNYL